MRTKEIKRNLAWDDFKVIDWRCILIPIQISYAFWKWPPNNIMEYRTLYVFGLRIARWRV